jgi:hypothetical protein
MTQIPKGAVPESWRCVDCNLNTAPGVPNRIELEQAFNSQMLSATGGGPSFKITYWCEIYTVRPAVWLHAGMKPFGGCLCIGCLERRLGRQLRPKDFDRRHPFNALPGTERLLDRREGPTP